MAPETLNVRKQDFASWGCIGIVRSEPSLFCEVPRTWLRRRVGIRRVLVLSEIGDRPVEVRSRDRQPLFCVLSGSDFRLEVMIREFCQICPAPTAPCPAVAPAERSLSARADALRSPDPSSPGFRLVGSTLVDPLPDPANQHTRAVARLDPATGCVNSLSRPKVSACPWIFAWIQDSCGLRGWHTPNPFLARAFFPQVEARPPRPSLHAVLRVIEDPPALARRAEQGGSPDRVQQNTLRNGGWWYSGPPAVCGDWRRWVINELLDFKSFGPVAWQVRSSSRLH